MIGRKIMVVLICFIFFSSYGNAELLHFYSSSDESVNGIRLTYFSVEGSEELNVGMMLYMNFTLLNVNDPSLTNFVAFASVEKPNGSIMRYSIVENASLGYMDEVIVNTTVTLTEAGSWSLWPSYEFYTNSFVAAPEKKTSPLYWHAYNFTVTEGFPDLVIDTVSCDWEDKEILFTIRNNGAVDVLDDFTVTLYVNDEKKKETLFTPHIAAGGTYHSSFDAAEILYGNDVDISLFVDFYDVIEEENEKNNHYQITCQPTIDTTSPLFVSGPSTTDITLDSAKITWETDEISNGMVRYGTILGAYAGEIHTNGFSKKQTIRIDHLKENTAYHCQVEVWDESGNKASSKTFFFKTAIHKDNTVPSASLQLKTNISKPLIILASASDDSGVDHVSFYLDGKIIYTKYSPPYNIPFNPGDYEEGSHDFGMQVVDVTGTVENIHEDIHISHTPLLFEIPPEVTIISPVPNSEIVGNTMITVRVNHTEHIDRVEFYIDGELWHVEYGYHQKVVQGPEGMIIRIPGDYEELPFEKSYQHYLRSLEDISSFEGALVENRSTTIEVRVYDENGTMGRDSLVVYHGWDSPQEPSLGVSRTVTREDNHLLVTVTVSNHGYGSAHGVSITDQHYGFQVGQLVSYDRPTDYHIQSVSTVLYHDSSGISHFKPVEAVTFHLDGSLPGLSYWRFSYELFPLLSTDMAYAGFEIAAHTILGYDGIEERINDSYEPSPGWTEAIVSSAFEQADYLIVTNPINLYIYTPDPDSVVNELLLKMAELAREKRGALGYIFSGLSANDAHSVINNWGKNYLNSSWSSHGYLLLVGETEILPSFTAHWDRDYDSRDETIHCTDYPYANTGGKTISPELCVGRILGNKSASLIIPIQNSLAVHYGQATFKRGWEPGAKAFCMSGRGDGESAFWSSASSVSSKLSNAGYQTTTIRGKHYDDIIDRFNVLRSYADGCSVIFYRNHGDGNGKAWSGVVSSYQNATDSIDLLSFGDAHPLVFACCCCAGQYEDNLGYGAGGEDGIAENFLRIGAGVYIGSTEVSMRNTNSEYSDYFFDRWANNPNKNIAQAWKDTRREAADEWWFENDRYWSAEYQFYGDPKFGE